MDPFLDESLIEEEDSLPSETLSSDSPPNMASSEVSADYGSPPKLKSAIHMKGDAADQPPKLEDNSRSPSPNSTMNESSESDLNTSQLSLPKLVDNSSKLRPNAMMDENSAMNESLASELNTSQQSIPELEDNSRTPSPTSMMNESSASDLNTSQLSLPKLEDNSTTPSPSSMINESSAIELNTSQLSVDTTYQPLAQATPSIQDCRACNPIHPEHNTYAFKQSTVNESEDSHWVKCDHCEAWFHCECVDMEQYETFLIDVFSCPSCRLTSGPSREKECVAPHRNKFDEMTECEKPIEVGTQPWLREFIKDEETKYMAPPASHVTVFEDGTYFEGDFNRYVEWKNIFLIKKKAGLGLQMPEPGEMYIDELVEILGEKRLVEAIDVYRQATVTMSVGRYSKLLANPDRPRLFNILSLEFTKTKLAELVRPPSIVAELSWAEKYWPERLPRGEPEMLELSGVYESCDTAHSDMRPDVELFCLMGMGGSFTDFHIDFGGSSVWYHVYKGKKIFYIVEPTRENLDMYQKHQLRTDREIYLGDVYKEKCWRVEIDEGMTLMIPSGWIHAVYTPFDSLVFGGNFLTNLNVDLQCEVNSHENRCLFESRYLYPNFEIINWYAARTFIELLKEQNDDDTDDSNEDPNFALVPMYVVRGAKALMETLAEWVARDRKSTDKEIATHPSRPFIHGESQISILHNITKEFKMVEKKLTKQQEAQLRVRRMNKAIKPEDEPEDEEKKTNDGRYTISVPQVLKTEPLRLKIPRKSETTEMEKESSSVLTTPKLVIRMNGDDAASLPAVVTEEEIKKEERSIDGIDMVSMFASPSRTGRTKKPASWVRAQFGEEIERERGMEDEEREHDSTRSVDTSHSMDTSRSDDADYDDALERAERGGGGGGGSGEGRKAQKRKIEKAPSSSPQAKERKKASSFSTPQQRLAEKMKKNLKKH